MALPLFSILRATPHRDNGHAVERASAAASRIEALRRPSASCPKLVRAMSNRAHRALPSTRALWAAATAFWLLVTAMADAQIV